VTDKGAVALQNCVDLLKAAPAPSNETCLQLSRDENEVISTKTEAVDAQEEEMSLSETFTGTGIRQEVSCTYECLCFLGSFHTHPYLPLVLQSKAIPVTGRGVL
jgi:hypothetical protein